MCITKLTKEGGKYFSILLKDSPKINLLTLITIVFDGCKPLLQAPNYDVANYDAA